MSKKLGARTQPCFTQFLMEMGAEDEPLNGTVPFKSSWNEGVILIEIGRGVKKFEVLWHKKEQKFQTPFCTPFKPGTRDLTCMFLCSLVPRVLSVLGQWLVAIPVPLGGLPRVSPGDQPLAKRT